MTRDPQVFSRQILSDYLESHPEPGSPFWSVREISHKYGCSVYSAHFMLKKFLAEDYLEVSPKRGAFLKRHVSLDLLAMTLKVQPAFAWPVWHRDSPGNFAAEYAREIELICQESHFSHTFFDGPQLWEDPHFSARFKATGSNALLTINPPPSAVLAFAELHSAGIPVLLLGAPRWSYKALVNLSLDGDEKKSMHMLLLRLRSEGVQRPLIIGSGGNFHTSTKIVEGVQCAFPEIEDIGASGFFINTMILENTFREISARLDGDRPPDALIFVAPDFFEMAVRFIPDFLKRIKNLHIAIYDDIGIHHEYPEIPLITVVMSPALMAKKTIHILKKRINGIKQPERTLIPRVINWPQR